MTTPAPFTLYPAIDILGGTCVRLLKGDYDAKTTYGKNPTEMALRWIQEGAAWLHIVDLDAAKTGIPTNTEAIQNVVRAASKFGVSIQVGGGIRTLDTMKTWLDLGVTRCVVGTAATNLTFVEGAVMQFGGDALVIGLDGRNGKLAVHGWLEQTETSLVELAESLVQVGARHALVTDVERDGTLQGANLDLASQIQATGMQAIASGGIRNVDDVLEAKRRGLAGAIAGRSIYDGTLSVQTAVSALKEGSTC